MNRFIDRPHKLRGDEYPTRRFHAARVKSALKIAAAQHDTTVTDIMETAIAYALKKYAKVKE
jgi:hypothetical protein